jgi:hypothetical protein
VASGNPSDADSEEESEESESVAQEEQGGAEGGGQDSEVQAMVEAGLAANEQELESLEEPTESSSSSADSDSDAEAAAAEAAAAEQALAGGGAPTADGEDPAAGGGAPPAASESDLDGELMQSLEVFEGEMAGRILVLASANPDDLEGDLEPMPAGGDGEEDGEGTPDQTGDGAGLVLVEGDLSLLEGGEAGEGTNTVTSGVITGGGEMPDPESEREGEFKTGRLIAQRLPEDIGDGSDDDVVARQIREAAMNEKDPVLREKLWEEYRNYKKSIR